MRESLHGDELATISVPATERPDAEDEDGYENDGDEDPGTNNPSGERCSEVERG